MSKNYYYIDGSVAAGQTTLAAIQNESANFGIGATTAIETENLTVTTLKVGTGVTVNSGIVTAIGGFISQGGATPIKITLNGNILSFTAVGIGSTFFTLA